MSMPIRDKVCSIQIQLDPFGSLQRPRLGHYHGPVWVDTVIENHCLVQ